MEIGVADTGPGISAEDAERIFDLYFTTKAAGTGLGLSLVHRVVAEHGGRVEVQSDRGAGARFVIQDRGMPSCTAVARSILFRSSRDTWPIFLVSRSLLAVVS